MIIPAAIGLAGGDILDIAVVVVIDPGQPNFERLADRPGNRAFEDGLIVAAVGTGQVTFEMVGRLVGDELHRAAGRVAAKQRALRSAQRLGPGKVEDREARRGDRTGVGIVLIHRDGRFLLIAIVVLRHAANVEDDLRRRIGVELEIRDGAHDVGRVGDVVRLHIRGCEDTGGDADVSQSLLTTLRGDDDVAQSRGCGVRLRRRVLRYGRAGADTGGHCEYRRPSKKSITDVVLPRFRSCHGRPLIDCHHLHSHWVGCCLTAGWAASGPAIRSGCPPKLEIA